jgi:hypothetical protein
MAWVFRILACLGLAASAADAAFAETRNFNAPSIRGVRVDLCMHWGSDCGKPAADLFCREMGFSEAQNFIPANDIGGRVGRTLVFGDGRFCEGAACDGFGSITCVRPDERAATTAPSQPSVADQSNQSNARVGTSPGTVKQPKKPGTLAANPNPPKPPSKGGQAAAQPGGPVIAMPGGASLIRCASSSCEFAVTFNFDIDPNDQFQSHRFIGDVEKVTFAKGFRWQVTASPFPAFKSGAVTDLKPPRLVASGDVGGKKDDFYLDFKKIVSTMPGPPSSMYVRILPLAQAGTDVIVGQPSNTIRVYYGAEPPPQPPIVIYESTPPILFSVKVVSFTPPDFENPNRWGCVKIVGHKGNVPAVFKSQYPIGGEICPKSFKGGSGQITSFGEFIDWVTGGAGGALDWVSARYEDLKEIAVDVVLNYTPFGQQCKLIGEAIDGDAPSYCKVAAEVAVNAGLAALGLPPTIPNYNELIDKGVDYAVEMAAAEIYAQTGYPCIELCHDALHDAFSAAAEDLKNASYTPGCVGENEAHQHGREPLCLPDFIIAKPASGAIYSPPVATVEVTRLSTDKNPTSIYNGGCSLSVGIGFENQFSGGTVWGPPYSGKTVEVPAQPISGYLYKGINVPVAEFMPKGSKKTMTLVFSAPEKFLFSWTKQLWKNSQIPPKDFMGGDWFALYWGAVAKVGASLNCAAKGDTLAYQLPDY